MTLTVGDVMTTEVVTAREDTPFKELATMLTARRISAVPVVDAENNVVGVVSETDLLYKQEYRDEVATRRRHRMLHALPKYKASGTSARDVMSAPPVTVPAEMTVVQAARLMDTRGIQRLPVVDGGGRHLRDRRPP